MLMLHIRTLSKLEPEMIDEEYLHWLPSAACQHSDNVAACPNFLADLLTVLFIG